MPWCARILQWTVLALACLLCHASNALGGDARSGERVTLDNQLLVSGPQVELVQPYGFHYHPGAAVVLEGVVGGVGDAFEGGITVQEGSPELGPRYGKAMSFTPGAPVTFRFPIRAPASGAVLELSVWERDGVTGARRDRFRASLVGKLSVALRGERIVWWCGRPGLSQPREGWHINEITGAQLPEQAWMYENVDLIVLGQGAFDGMSTRAQEMLRLWVLGGGRILITRSAMTEDVVRAALTPLDANLSAMPRTLDEWLEQTGLREKDVVRDARFQPVYAAYEFGHGGGVFFFPNAEPQSMRARWNDAATHARLRHPRDARPDLRVWAGPYKFFGLGVLGAHRRHRAGVWALVGALLLVGALAYFARERKAYLAAGFSVGAVALFAALLAKWFPVPDVVVSRATLVDVSRDGRAATVRQFAFLDGLRDVSNLTVAAPSHVALAPVHQQQGELAEADTDLSVAGGGLRYAFRPVFPPPPAPLFQAWATVAPPANEMTTARMKLKLPEGRAGTSENFLDGCLASAGHPARGAVFVGADWSRKLLLEPLGSPAKILPWEGETQAIMRCLPGLSPADAELRARFLSHAVERAAETDHDMLVFFDEVDPGTENGEALTGMIATGGLRGENGSHFIVWIAEVDVDGAWPALVRPGR